jgi:acyl-coenzyme A synthetase/AMP-(fatty) acid ligase
MVDLGSLIRRQLAGPREDQMVCYRGDWLTRGWVHDFAERLSTAIEALGLPAGSPIGFVPHSRPEFLAATLALLERGQTITMIYAYQSGEAIGRKLSELNLPVVIAARDQVDGPMLEAALAQGTAVISLSRDGPMIETMASWRPSTERPHRGAPDEPAVELLTSGTTGPPKLFPMSYDRLLGRMVNSNSLGNQVRRPQLLFFPLGNISGLYILMGLVASDDPVILLDKFNVPDWVAFVREVRPEVTNLPPAAFRMILDADVAPEDLASIRYIATGAATLDPTLRREFEAHYPPIRIMQSYGATEFGGVVAAVMPEHVEAFDHAKADAVGRPFGGAQWRILDLTTGEPLPPGQEGRIEVLAPAMSDAWIGTTDLGVVDEDGFLYHRGRLDGAIMRGGFKIMPEQIAEALSSHPGVGAAGVVGRDEPRLGQVPVAAIERQPGVPTPDEAELEAHVRARLPSTMLPAAYLFVDALPRTPSLKIDMAAVHRLFEDRPEDTAQVAGVQA